MNEQVLFKERQWQSVCGTILGHGRSALAPINLVQATEDFVWMNSAGFKDNIGQGNGEAGEDEVPFKQELQLNRPYGETVHVSALFDRGAMVGAMFSLVFQMIKHRLTGWGLSR
jgi:hypothetical protein